MSKTTIPKSEYEFYKQQKEAMELKQEQTQELQEQDRELVEMLLKCQVLCETLKVNVVAKEIKNLLTKHNHLNKKL